MNPKDLKDILLALEMADVREFSLKTAEYDLNIKRGAEAPVYVQAPIQPVQAQPVQTSGQTQPAPAQATAQAAQAQPPVTEAAAPATPVPTPGTPVKAPIVGTFYTSSSPDAPVYVKVGDTVVAGQILCIIEAMKLMNEIEAETAGTLREILVKNGEPVEYGQTLFIIE
ncbi:acetyl-CoA carboxylase biotin carboxyl carrier protein [Deinococcus radiomollis]|uniref:acetyl-CoA carboxylase biotin carboxyl carrier protein n=1 Tax=Deinococcus radiomollis TaxID=468916 RepID=UPI0038915B7A